MIKIFQRERRERSELPKDPRLASAFAGFAECALEIIASFDAPS